MRADRIVEPDIAAGDERAADLHVVLLDEHDASAQLGVAGHLEDRACVGLAARVARMGLAREDELHGALRIAHDACEPVDVGEDERRALVGGEAPREPDGERLRIERAREFIERRGHLATALAGAHDAVAREAHHLRAQRGAHGPESGGIGGERPLPRAVARRVRHGVEPARVLPERDRLGVDPRRGVDAVGHMRDGHILGLAGAVDPLPHGARHLAMQRGHAVHLVGEAQAHDGHAHGLLRVRRILARERLELGARNAAARERACQAVAHHLDTVAVVPRGDGRVRGEHGARAHGLHRIGVRHAGRAETGEHLHRGESGVPLVQVDLGWLDAERPQRDHAADAEQHLLAHSQERLALVQALGELPVLRGVLGEIRVEQEHARAAHIHAQDAHTHIRNTHGHLDHQPRVGHGHVGAVIDRVQHLGRAILGKLLDVVAVAVVEADGDQRHAEIARTLEVVAREHAEATRVLLDALVQRVLRAEVGDGGVRLALGAGLVPPGAPRHLGGQRGARVGEGDAEAGLLACGGERGWASVGKHRQRRVLGRVPEHGIECRERAAHGLVPGPPEVERERAQLRARLVGRERCGSDGATRRGPGRGLRHLAVQRLPRVTCR